MFRKNVSLRAFNTFGIDAKAKKFAEVNSLDQLLDIVSKHKNLFVLSGGSNILLTQDIDKPVLHLNTKGIELVDKKEDKVWVKCQAGENWHEFVLWCLSHDFGGLENLSLIPGNVGTSPMQNIGAYGVEIKDCFDSLEALEISSGKIKTFRSEDCEFGYRESVFKNRLRGEFIIVSVTFQLSAKNHTINDDYGAIKDQLKLQGVNTPTIQDISEAVIAIRRSKLPDPKEIGNSGSFFKNPVIPKSHFLRLQTQFPDIPHYIVSEEEIKIPAGWLVEKCGYKGMRFGDAGVHKNQALVLVNYNNATGEQLLSLAKKIQQSVAKKFEINLEMEVNIL